MSVKGMKNIFFEVDEGFSKGTQAQPTGVFFAHRGQNLIEEIGRWKFPVGTQAYILNEEKERIMNPEVADLLYHIGETLDFD